MHLHIFPVSVCFKSRRSENAHQEWQCNHRIHSPGAHRPPWTPASPLCAVSAPVPGHYPGQPGPGGADQIGLLPSHAHVFLPH